VKSPVFEWLCEELQRITGWDIPATRGTIRLALKPAGLDPKTLTLEQSIVVIERLIPPQLRSRGVSDPDEVCRPLLSSARLMRVSNPPEDPESPEAAFRRFKRGDVG
jgi:hypothetical protein